MTAPTCYRCGEAMSPRGECGCPDGICLVCGDCRDVLPMLEDGCVDLVLTDPPYFKVKGDWWDRQWDTPETFLAWLGGLCEQWQRVLRGNGSLYVFASPQMAARVECLVGERFAVLSSVTWLKHDGAGQWETSGGKWRQACKEELRTFFPRTETIIFAEHYNADNAAKGEAGYGAKCDELRGFVFEPLRAYLAGERDRAGFTTRQVAKAFQQKTGSRTVTGMSGHWLERVQWTLPTEENYEWLRSLFNASCNGSPQYLRREYEDLRREYEDLRREYEDLRREYEDLRRPFSVSADVPYTDVWDFPTVQDYKGKHPCEKPLRMIEHIVQVSSRPGAMVLDCFAGSGVVGRACRSLGRRAVLVEIDEKYCRIAAERLRQEVMF